MNRDPEDIQRRLLKLVQALIPTASLTDEDVVSRIVGMDETSLSAPELPAQDGNLPTSGFIGSSRSPQREPTVELGDVPAVQDRFHALLKHRLQTEIQQNPPLFPWETEFRDYEADTAYGAVEAGGGGELPLTGPQTNSSPAWVWGRHLNTIHLPVPVPSAVLAQLLGRCQAIAQSSLKEGSKLVQAVEDLFPQQSEALNYLAGLVMPAPARSPNTKVSPVAKSNFPANYETAATAQQMVLSLLAAREILSALTLTVSSAQPAAERQWETDVGILVLQAMYDVQADGSKIRVQVTLPCGGSVSLRGMDSQVVSERSTAGLASVELFEPQIAEVYPLEIRLAGQDQTPLTFSMGVVEA